MDLTHYKNKIMESLNDKNTHEQLSLQTIDKNVDVI